MTQDIVADCLVALLLVAALFVWGCRVAASPQVVHDQIELTFEHGDLDAASSLADRAIQQYRGDQEWAWRFRVLKARFLVYKSAYQDALAILQEAPPSSLAATDIGVRRSLVQGMAYRVAQDFDKSTERLAEAHDLASRNHPQLLCEVLNAEASLQVSEKKLEKAQATYNQALGLARKFRRAYQEAAALTGLAWVAISQDRFDEAVDLGQAAFQFSRSLGLRGMGATALGNLGWSYFELGDFENALNFYRQGAQASSTSGLSGYSAYWFSAVATAYLALRDYASAEELARTTLERAHELKNAQTITVCNNTLAEIMLKTGRFDEAEQYNREALKMEEEGQDKFGTLDSVLMAGDIADAQRRFSDAENFFQRVLMDPGAETRRRWVAEAGLAQVWDDQGRFVEAERQYLKAINTIEQARGSVNHDELRLSFLSSGIEVYGAYIDSLVRHGRTADALRQAELSRARTLAEGLSSDVKSISRTMPSEPPQQLARRLHATLLFYWLGEKHSYLWAITPSGTISFTLPPVSEIDPLVKAYGKAIVNSHDVLATEDRQVGEKLFATLIAPAQKLIPANSRVILLPDGSLNGLNFETLIPPQPRPHFWIEDVTLTTANSLTLLGASANRPATKEKRLLLVGNPKLANPAFPPLSQAPVEISKIQPYFPDSRRTVLDGDRATPAAYLDSNPERFSYVHFVTHGTASRTRPLESAVILSAQPGGDTYKLYARDILTRRLQADLVTISACYGSGSRTYSGEGLVGLSWAFLRAGAHNVIGALWEVADAPSTPQIMDGLYKELSQGKDPATALRDAKLNLLHSTNVFAKPFYWAPFQLYAGS